MQIYKYFVAALSLLLCSLPGISQSVSSPTMPNMPSMPTVSSPVMSQSFYTPGTFDVNRKSSSDKSSSNNQTDTAKSSSSVLSPEETIQKAAISANDISSLGSLGLLGNLTSVSDAGNPSSTTLLLKQILAELTELKKQVAEAQALIKARTPIKLSKDEVQNESVYLKPEPVSNAIEVSNESNRRNTASILRFIVNGYSILSTCRTVYVSQIQPDGSFLVTGDRRYLSDGSFYTETFYLLFHPTGARNGTEIYTVAVSVSQDKPNPYSYVYQMAQNVSFEASRTGNLVTLHQINSGRQIDILLDIGSQS